MHPRVTWALVLLALGGAASCHARCADLQAEVQGFNHCLDLTDGYSVAWKADNSSIWFAVDAATTGWAGLGISEAGGMKGADLIVLSPAEDGTLRVIDNWSTDFGPPVPDNKQDVQLVDGPGMTLAPKPGRIRAVVRRPLQSCDSQDIAITPYLTQHLVWAKGPAAWPSYHGGNEKNRGDEVVTFIPRPGAAIQQRPSALQPGEMQLELRMPNVTIPAQPTTYLCTHFHLPDARKYHIIARQALISSPYVHHMILFACNEPQPDVGTVFDCLRMQAACSQFGLGWAPGQDYFEFPPEVGMAFGTAPKDELPVPAWFALQVHYNNPEADVITQPDTSGMRITYTPKLRPNDIGVLTLTQMQLDLPPHRDIVVAAPSLCPSECTRKLVTQPVTMLYTLLHMHQAGRTIRTQHIRNNTELPPLGVRSAWDFNHQEAVPIPLASRTLLPGDALITRCTYNTTKRSNTTKWGEGTMDEMCFDFVLYWPRLPDLEYCATNPPPPGWNISQPLPAVCGSTAAITHAQGNSPFSDSQSNSTKASPEEQRALAMRLEQAGVLLNGTWPTGYMRYKDPRCRLTGPAVQAASGLPLVL